MMKILATLLMCLSLFGTSTLGQDTDREAGIALYREGKFSEAMELLEKAVAARPDDRSAWMYLGGAHVHIGDKTKAAEAFGKKISNRNVTPSRYDRSVKVTRKPKAGYTHEARRKSSSGTVRIAVEFLADGTIGFVFPLPTTLDESLVRQSVEAARGMEFEPAVRDGKPVTTISFVEYSFWTA